MQQTFHYHHQEMPQGRYVPDFGVCHYKQALQCTPSKRDEKLLGAIPIYIILYIKSDANIGN